MTNSDNFFKEFSQHIFDVVAEISVETQNVHIHFAKNKKELEGKSLSVKAAIDYLKNIIVVDNSNLSNIGAGMLKRLYAEKPPHKAFPFIAETKPNITKRYVLTLYPVSGKNTIYATVSREENMKGVITFKYRKNTLTFNISDIIYIGYGNHCVKIFTDNGCTNMFNISFNDAADLVLEHNNFARSYKNCIINMDKVVRLENDSFIMTNDDVIAIPKRRLKEIKNRYQEYIISK